ncbi:helix-turn-helix domain-containing protein [Methanobrevibacter sp.]|uniref:winged helix-turn-helix transcriptional regulator n=1 Tax=Methanobrevibacter sp. TaxID=66852 RepID=UPI0025D24DC0|nr:helix-turn-helix domain-containing protein [Methanobrevibacter sp.]MBQ2665197.1 helix-turn-helix transcriptional regulator [Methanobrevibacter sp.]
MDEKKLRYYERKYERNPVEDAIKDISNKWTLHILRDLFLGKSHFNEFQTNRKTLDNKSLTRCLKTMEKNGLIMRLTEDDEITYHLTEKGHSLNKVFYELLLFALNNDKNNEHYNDYEKEELKEMYLDILDLK